jgi:hypothetical protein
MSIVLASYIVGKTADHLYYYYSKKKARELVAHAHFRSGPLPVTSLPFRAASGDVISGQGRFRIIAHLLNVSRFKKKNSWQIIAVAIFLFSFFTQKKEIAYY